MRRVQPQKLLSSLPQAAPEHAAGRQRVQRMDRLESSAARVGPRITKYRQAGAGVAERGDEHPADHEGAADAEQDMRDVGAGGEIDRHGDHDQHERRRHVALHVHDAAQQPDDQAERKQPFAHRLELVAAAPDQPRRQVYNQRELRQLDRLELLAADTDPASRTAGGGHVLGQHQYQQQQHDRERKQRHGEPLPRPVVDAHTEQQPDRSKCHPQKLALQVVRLCLAFVDGDEKACTVDHHQPEDRQCHHQRQQRVVRFGLGCVEHNFTPQPSQT